MKLRRYLIFLSSTFRDMDAERDAVKFYVINKLNRRFRRYNISFQIVDLRIGINTQTMEERESENKVLEMCLSKIDQARPFFIGLLGNRYGWCPQDIRIETVLSRLGASAEKDSYLGRSVTEMEIIHSLRQGDSAFKDSLFFIRSEKSYEGIPSYMLENIDDRFSTRSTAAAVEKLANLKLRLKNDSERLNSGNVYIYDLIWNTATNQFDNIEDFIELVYNAMCRRVESELEELSAHKQWHQIEEDMVKAHFELASLFSVPLHILRSEPLIKNILLTGSPGSGKTVALSQIYNRLQADDGYIVLAAAVGASEEALTMERIFIRWIYELSEQYDSELLDIKDLERLNRNDLKQKLVWYCRQALSYGKQPAFIMDSIERFIAYNPNDILNDWLPEGCLYIAAADASKAEEIKNSFMAETYIIDTITATLTESLIDNFQAYYAIELPSEMRQDMVCQRLVPRHIAFIFRFLSNLSSTDYVHIHQSNEQGTEIDKINSYIINLYNQAPKPEIQRLHYYLKAFVRAMNMNIDILRAVGYIAVSHCGLSREQIIALLGHAPSMLDLELVLNLAHDYIIEHPTTHVILFSRPAHAEEYLQTADIDPIAMALDVATLIEATPQEELTDDLALLKICSSVKGCSCSIANALLHQDIFNETGSTEAYNFSLWSKAAYLINESATSWRGLNVLIGTLPRAEAANLLYLMQRDFPLKDFDKLCVMADGMTSYGIEDLSLSSAYSLAWTMVTMAQYAKYRFSDAQRRVEYLNAAERLFSAILSRKHHYHDAQNMRLVALMELMEVYASKEDDISMMDVMAKLENLNI